MKLKFNFFAKYSFITSNIIYNYGMNNKCNKEVPKCYITNNFEINNLHNNQVPVYYIVNNYGMNNKHNNKVPMYYIVNNYKFNNQYNNQVPICHIKNNFNEENNDDKNKKLISNTEYEAKKKIIYNFKEKINLIINCVIDINKKKLMKYYIF